MKPKEYLSQIRRLEWSIYLNQEAIERVRTRMDLKGISYDTVRVQSSPEDTMPDLVACLIRLEEVTETKRNELDRLYTVITEQISGMDDILDQKLLYKHYVKNMSLGAVASDLHYSYDWIKHRHGIALQRFGEKYGPF